MSTKTIIEPFRIKSVEPIRWTTREERELLLRAAPEFPESNLAAALKNFRDGQFAASRGRLLFKTARIDIGSTNAPRKLPPPPTGGIQE